jgi:site-specific recombinase XerD
MKSKPPNLLARSLRTFFSDHLTRIRGISPNTILSYRDTFKLLLRFVASRVNRDVVHLELDDLGPPRIIEFLQYLEDSRKNKTASRNVRLAAIHSFFRYLAAQYPERLEHSQRILAVPFKRTSTPLVDYLEYTEIQALLNAIDRSKIDGRRDYTLLTTLFNTGARVQEILDLRPCDLQLNQLPHARLRGKGRKVRLCPLWPQTAKLLRAFLCERRIDPASVEPLFRNHKGEPLTRFGVRYILSRIERGARDQAPTLAEKRIPPHCVRHSTAVHLLQAGVDLVTISHWLGHASPNTTNRYATIDLEMKREPIRKAKPINEENQATASWRKDASILEWLERL